MDSRDEKENSKITVGCLYLFANCPTMKLFRPWSQTESTYQLFTRLSAGGILGVLTYQVMIKHAPNLPPLLTETVRIGAILLYAASYCSLSFVFDYFNEKAILRYLPLLRAFSVAVIALVVPEMGDGHLNSILKYTMIGMATSFLVALFCIQAKPVRRWCRYLAYALILTGIASTTAVQEKIQNDLFDTLAPVLFLIADGILLFINWIMIRVLKEQYEQTLLDELGNQ